MTIRTILIIVPILIMIVSLAVFDHMTQSQKKTQLKVIRGSKK